MVSKYPPCGNGRINPQDTEDIWLIYFFISTLKFNVVLRSIDSYNQIIIKYTIKITIYG
jgi:hypothetical protein